VKKDGLQQRQNGDWTLRFTAQAKDLQPEDIHQVIVNANMGTRFLLTLVEIGDDEMPVEHKKMDRDKWRALGATAQAGIRCKQPLFWVWLSEEKRIACGDEEDAAKIVRKICGVETRRDLDKVGNAQARIMWHELDFEFQAWKAMEHA
jgi:hypothetical protein